MNKYSQKEFARLAKVSRQTLYNWEQKGILVPYRDMVGRPYYTNEHLTKVQKEWVRTIK